MWSKDKRLDHPFPYGRYIASLIYATNQVILIQIVYSLFIKGSSWKNRKTPDSSQIHHLNQH